MSDIVQTINIRKELVRQIKEWVEDNDEGFYWEDKGLDGDRYIEAKRLFEFLDAL